MLKKKLLGVAMSLACAFAWAGSKIEYDVYDAEGNGPYSENSIWVLQHSYSMMDGWFSTYKAGQGGVQFSYSRSAPADTSPSHLRLVFTPPMAMGLPLAIGAYEGAQRASFALPNRPGLDISIDSTGFNEIDGRFQVYEVEWSTDGVVTSFAATFDVFAFRDKPLISGRIWYNSDVQILTVPEPGAMTLVLCGLAASAFVCRKRKVLDV